MAKRRKKKRINVLPIMFLILMGLVVGFLIAVYIKKYAPTKETMPMEQYLDIQSDDELAIILNGRIAEKNENDEPLAYTYEGRAVVTLDYIKDQLDDRYYFDSNENILRYTTPEKINSASAGENCYYAAGEQVELSYTPFVTVDDKICVDTEFITRFSPVTCDVYSNRVVFYTDGFVKNFYKVKRKTQLRRFGGPKSPILAEVAKGTRVAIIEDYDNWCYVISENGELGCIKTSKIKEDEEVFAVAENEKFEENHNNLGRDISMAFYQTTNELANGMMMDAIADVSNVNVLCPTWFYVNDNSGGVEDLASKDIVDQCHAKGYQIWALFSNVEKSSVDYETIINTTSLREAMIKRVVSSAVASGIDGINLDFEEISVEGGDAFIELVRELALACRENNLVLSVNNYVPQNYNAHYDLEEQGIFADYVVIMGYDEHTAGSDEAGSNASYPFIRDGIVDTIDKVSPEQVILALPLYSRSFYSVGGDLKCGTISIKNMEELKQSNSYEWQEDLGLNYMKYVSDTDGIEKELWLEDEESLRLKFDLIREYELAGAAYWKLTFEVPYVWNLAGEYLNADKF